MHAPALRRSPRSTCGRRRSKLDRGSSNLARSRSPGRLRSSAAASRSWRCATVRSGRGRPPSSARATGQPSSSARRYGLAAPYHRAWPPRTTPWRLTTPATVALRHHHLTLLALPSSPYPTPPYPPCGLHLLARARPHRDPPRLASQGVAQQQVSEQKAQIGELEMEVSAQRGRLAEAERLNDELRAVKDAMSALEGGKAELVSQLAAQRKKCAPRCLSLLGRSSAASSHPTGTPSSFPAPHPTVHPTFSCCPRRYAQLEMEAA